MCGNAVTIQFILYSSYTLSHPNNKNNLKGLRVNIRLYFYIDLRIVLHFNVYIYTNMTKCF